MDGTARLWDVETGVALAVLAGHTAEVVSLHPDAQGRAIVTGSFDHTAKVTRRRKEVNQAHPRTTSTDSNPPSYLLSASMSSQIWDARTGQCLRTLPGHTGEIASAQFSYPGDVVLTASVDRTAKVRTCVCTLDC